MPFRYVVVPITAGQVYVAASTAVTYLLTIDPKADFQLRKLMYTATSSSFTIQVTDVSTGLTWESAPVNAANWGGTAQLPLWMTAPIVIPARAVLKFTVTDFSAQNNTIQIVLDGEDLYPIGPTTQVQQQAA